METDIQITDEAVLAYRLQILSKSFVEFCQQIEKAESIAMDLDSDLLRRLNVVAHGLALTRTAIDTTLGSLANFQRGRNDFESIMAEFRAKRAERERLVQKQGRYSSAETMQEMKRQLRWLSIRADGYEQLLKLELEDNICLSIELDRKRCLVLSTQVHFLCSAVSSFESMYRFEEDDAWKSNQYAALLEEIKNLEEHLLLIGLVLEEISSKAKEIYAPLLKVVETCSSEVRRLTQ
jgi:hypothetical protein